METLRCTALGPRASAGAAAGVGLAAGAEGPTGVAQVKAAAKAGCASAGFCVALARGWWALLLQSGLLA